MSIPDSMLNSRLPLFKQDLLKSLILSPSSIPPQAYHSPPPPYQQEEQQKEESQIDRISLRLSEMLKDAQCAVIESTLDKNPINSLPTLKGRDRRNSEPSCSPVYDACFNEGTNEQNEISIKKKRSSSFSILHQSTKHQLSSPKNLAHYKFYSDKDEKSLIPSSTSPLANFLTLIEFQLSLLLMLVTSCATILGVGLTGCLEAVGDVKRNIELREMRMNKKKKRGKVSRVEAEDI